MVFLIFAGPRFEMRLAGRREARWVNAIRVGGPALVFSLSGWINVQGLVWVFALTAALANCVMWSRCDDPRRFFSRCCLAYLRQIPSLLVTPIFLSWFMIVAVQVARACLPQAGASLQAVLVLGFGAIGWSCHRLIAKRGAAAILVPVSLMTAGMTVAHPGFAGLAAIGLYALNVGGGRADLSASSPTELLCDMGAFGKHFYVRAGEAGCSLDATRTFLISLQETHPGDRAVWLRSRRVEPAKSLVSN